MNKTSTKSPQPSFQNNHKKFNERSVTANNSKFNNNSARPNKSKAKNFSPRIPTVQTQIDQLSLSKANKEGTVNVVVKKQVLTNSLPPKKTGPLSPRAPEKIRKNRAEEMKVYGENACFALFECRPESIIRVWTTVEMSHRAGRLFSYLAANKKVYHVVDTNELTLVSGTEHHNGICMLVKKSRPYTLTGYLDIPRQRDCVVLLDGIQNAHNIGGIIRTCAVYGANAVIVEDSDILNSAAAMRVAEGGMEYIRTLEHSDSVEATMKLRQQGYQLVHCSQNKQAQSIHKLKIAEKVAFILSENHSEALYQEGDNIVNLSHSNPLKTGLNIAVATGVLLSAWQQNL